MSAFFLALTLATRSLAARAHFCAQRLPRRGLPLEREIQCLSVRAVSQSIRASSTPEATKARWMMTPHITSVSFSG